MTIPASVSKIAFNSGNSGFPRVQLNHPCGSSAEIYSHGATLTSLKLCAESELFYLSSRAVFLEGKAIRGGMPIVFPQFGGGALPQHGFARNLAWKGISAKENSAGALVAEFALESGSATKSRWTHDFRCTLKFELNEKLTIEAAVENIGTHEFEFQFLFHPYFRVHSATEVSIIGLQQVPYLDKVLGGIKGVETGSVTRLSGEVDRVHHGGAQTIYLHDPGLKRKIIIERSQFPDIVVWNPWQQKADGMSDMGTGEWNNFVCVEPGNVWENCRLMPQSTWRASMSIAAAPL